MKLFRSYSLFAAATLLLLASVVVTATAADHRPEQEERRAVAAVGAGGTITKRRLDQETVPPIDDSTEAPAEDPWGVGTHVYKDFGEEGWWHGVITSFENDVYTVVWDDDSTQQFDYDSEIDDDVVNASNYVALQAGTPVMKDSTSGSISSYAVRLCAGFHAVVVVCVRCENTLVFCVCAAQHWVAV